jgi:predicted membrane chloride channel (bestrophin family)
MQVNVSCFVYVGLLSLYTSLYNPFGADACDFPVESYQVLMRMQLRMYE